MTAPEKGPVAPWTLHALANAVMSTPEQLTALVMVGWLPPADEMRDGVYYWSDEKSDAVAMAYGEWLAHRAAEQETSLIADAVIGAAKRR